VCAAAGVRTERTRNRVASDWTITSALAELRVPGVTERVAEQVEREHGQADREAGEDREPRRLLHERAARAAQHESPRRRGRLRPDTEEAQRGLDEDRVAEPDRRDDEDGRGDIRQDVGQQNARLLAADGFGGFDVAVL